MLAGNTKLREQFGLRGQQFVKGNFAVEKMVDSIYNLYLKFIAANKMTNS
jgi:hypothetical protein